VLAARGLAGSVRAGNGQRCHDARLGTDPSRVMRRQSWPGHDICHGQAGVGRRAR
jgi:hypothetical protein